MSHASRRSISKETGCRSRRARVVFGLGALLLAFAGFGCGSETTSPADQAIKKVSVGSSPVSGAQDAWVTLIEFADFECSFCQRAEATLSSIKSKYGTDLRIVFKYFPIASHPNGLSSARAAECAKAQGAFWEMHDRLFANGVTNSDVKNHAAALSLDLDAFDACLNNGSATAQIEADIAEGIRSGVKGTPTFFINGRQLPGLQPIENFNALIDEELQKARASGIPASEYYDKAILQAE